MENEKTIINNVNKNNCSYNRYKAVEFPKVPVRYLGDKLSRFNLNVY